MTSVTNVQQIVAIIREQLAAPLGRRSGGRSSPARTDSSGSRGDLQALIGKRVASIDRGDPDRGRKAFRVFLESVLLAELDEGIINDPQFYRIVDEVQRQMESDPGLADSVNSAIDHLLSAQPPTPTG